MKLQVLASFAVLLASTALAQGPTCGSASAISGSGAFPFDLTGRMPAGPVGAGCPVDTGPNQGDVFWQWTCTAAGDYQFEIAAAHATDFVIYEGSGCGATFRVNESGFTYALEVSDRQLGDQLLLHMVQHVNSPDAVGTLSVSPYTEACATTPDDGFEENDTPAAAVPISAGNYTNHFVWRGDEDHYLVTVPAADTLRVDWQWTASQVALRVSDTNCGAVAYSIADTWSWTNTGNAPVDLILNFEMRQVGSDCSSYDFDILLGPAPCLAGTDDGFEPNDTCPSAIPLGVGSYTSLVTRDADHDYYAIQVDPGFRLDVVGNHNAMLVAMFAGNCTLQSEAVRLNDYTNLGGSPEIVVFRVRPDTFFSNGCEIYDLTVSLAPDFCVGQADDAFEDNDSVGTAAVAIPGMHENLWVSIYDSDYYRVCLAPGASLFAQIIFADNLIALDMVLLNQPGAQYTYGIDLVRVELTNTTTSTMDLTLFVQVLPFVGDCGSYTLELQGTQACTPSVTPFCLPGGNNSSGGPTNLQASFGSGVGSGLHLEALGGPPGQFGYFLVGTGWVPAMSMLGDGTLCLLNPVGRYNGNDGGPVTESIGQFSASGVFVNLGGSSTTGSGFDVPGYVPLHGTLIAPGESWSFQLWHRDLNNGVPTVNFSTGVEVVF